MRQVIELEAAGRRLIGTLHRPPDGTAVAEVGVLVLSPGHVARAGAGDLFPQVGDALAALGLPVFRFDFPGLGDSFGPLPEHEQQYFRFLQEGGNVDCVAPLLAALQQRHGLRGVVLGGLCGGAITAVYASADATVRGLLLLDPEFGLQRRPEQRATAAAAPPPPPPGRLRGLFARLRRPRSWIRFATGESRPVPMLVPLQRLLMPLARRLVGRRPPADCNFELIELFQQAVRRRLPVLVLTARGMLRELYYDQVEKVVRARVDAQSLTHVSVADTNHVFTAGGARSVVLAAIADWARQWQPQGWQPQPTSARTGG